MAVRTDLALELAEGRRVQQRSQTLEGFSLHTVTVTESDTDFGRPPGRYVTLSIRDLLRRETDAFPRACRAVAQILRQLALKTRARRCSLLVWETVRSRRMPSGRCAVRMCWQRGIWSNNLPSNFARFGRLRCWRRGGSVV